MPNEALRSLSLTTANIELLQTENGLTNRSTQSYVLEQRRYIKQYAIEGKEQFQSWGAAIGFGNVYTSDPVAGETGDLIRISSPLLKPRVVDAAPVVRTRREELEPGLDNKSGKAPSQTPEMTSQRPKVASAESGNLKKASKKTGPVVMDSQKVHLDEHAARQSMTRPEISPFSDAL